MNLGELRSLAQLRLKDLSTRQYDPILIDKYLSEALRVMASETLLLEDLDSNLAYNSAFGGFALPYNFIKHKHLEWLDSVAARHPIEQVSLSNIYRMRNEWLVMNEDSADALTPMGFAIHNKHIILDSTSTTSPYLHYYKYDVELETDTDEPSFDREYDTALIDYVFWKIEEDSKALRRWEFTLKKMRGSKMRQTKGLRARYVGL